MEDKGKLLESLLDSAKEYGITTFELVKLKALDKTTDVVSSFVPSAVFIVLIALFFLFLSLGLALWLGDLLGKTYLWIFRGGRVLYSVWTYSSFLHCISPLKSSSVISL